MDSFIGTFFYTILTHSLLSFILFFVLSPFFLISLAISRKYIKGLSLSESLKYYGFHEEKFLSIYILEPRKSQYNIHYIYLVGFFINLILIYLNFLIHKEMNQEWYMIFFSIFVVGSFLVYQELIGETLGVYDKERFFLDLTWRMDGEIDSIERKYNSFVNVDNKLENNSLEHMKVNLRYFEKKVESLSTYDKNFYNEYDAIKNSLLSHIQEAEKAKL